MTDRKLHFDIEIDPDDKSVLIQGPENYIETDQFKGAVLRMTRGDNWTFNEAKQVGFDDAQAYAHALEVDYIAWLAIAVNNGVKVRPAVIRAGFAQYHDGEVIH